MRTTLQLIAVVLLALSAVAIVCAVNAPAWLDGKPIEKAVEKPVAAKPSV